MVDNINAYLAPASNVLVFPRSKPISKLPEMARGNSPTDGGHLLLRRHEAELLISLDARANKYIKAFYGSDEIIKGIKRYCIWIDDEDVSLALEISEFQKRIDDVRAFREKSSKTSTRKAAEWSHRFDERKPLPTFQVIAIPIRSSENRPYLPVDVLPAKTAIANTAFSLAGQPLWVLAIVASRIHLAWVASVCGRLELRFSYTNTLAWNTFPVPTLTEQNKADLTHCAEEILLAREHYFPANIADMYDPDRMDSEFPLVRQAHDRNDEVLERIYIGRRFKNDTERLEKLFELYTKMTTKQPLPKKLAKRKT